MSPPSNKGIVSRSAERLRYMQRTGMLYAIMACILIGCTAKDCHCGGCQWLCRGWNKLFACETICDARVKLINATNGEDLTGVKPGSVINCEVSNTVTGIIIFSGDLEINEDGTTATFPLDRCYQPCNDDLDAGEWAVRIFNFTIKTDDPSCEPGKCRRWLLGGAGTGIMGVGWNDGDCAPEINLALLPGPCGSC